MKFLESLFITERMAIQIDLKILLLEFQTNPLVGIMEAKYLLMKTNGSKIANRTLAIRPRNIFVFI